MLCSCYIRSQWYPVSVSQMILRCPTPCFIAYSRLLGSTEAAYGQSLFIHYRSSTRKEHSTLKERTATEYNGLEQAFILAVHPYLDISCLSIHPLFRILPQIDLAVLHSFVSYFTIRASALHCPPMYGTKGVMAVFLAERSVRPIQCKRNEARYDNLSFLRSRAGSSPSFPRWGVA